MAEPGSVSALICVKDDSSSATIRNMSAEERRLRWDHRSAITSASCCGDATVACTHASIHGAAGCRRRPGGPPPRVTIIPQVTTSLDALPTEAEALDAYSRVVIAVAERLGPSVANLRISRRSRLAGGGSGVVITPDGFLLTSAHVVSAAGARVRASFTDGSDVDVRVVGADPLSDLALLRAESARLHPAELGDAAKLRVGQLVVAIGNPHGYAGSSRPAWSPRLAARCPRARAPRRA